MEILKGWFNPYTKYTKYKANNQSLLPLLHSLLGDVHNKDVTNPTTNLCMEYYWET